tara:strand:- start:134 stop:256 length:123 start_codon:yes stop_codon:yes gene_type:complete
MQVDLEDQVDVIEVAVAVVEQLLLEELVEVLEELVEQDLH